MKSLRYIVDESSISSFNDLCHENKIFYKNILFLCSQSLQSLKMVSLLIDAQSFEKKNSERHPTQPPFYLFHDVNLVYSLLNLNKFHTLFWSFHCWLWTYKFRLGRHFRHFIYLQVTVPSLTLGLLGNFSKIVLGKLLEIVCIYMLNQWTHNLNWTYKTLPGFHFLNFHVLYMQISTCFADIFD